MVDASKESAASRINYASELVDLLAFNAVNGNLMHVPTVVIINNLVREIRRPITVANESSKSFHFAQVKG